MAEDRLQKMMAAAGVGSRRACEKMITDGRVQVNGHTVTELGTKVDPAVAQVTVNGRPVRLPTRHVYVKVHKPRGVLSDIGGDARGRKTVGDLAPSELRRVFPVGRLDIHSEGLVLLTDDGALAHKLTHPSFEHPKTYFVLLAKHPSGAELNQLRNGVDLPEGRTAPARVRVAARLPEELELAPGPTAGIWLEIELHEGKKRQIRHMTAACGHETLRLIRWSIGPLQLGGLASGASDYLSRGEVAALHQVVRNPTRGRNVKYGADSRQGKAKRKPRKR